MLPQDLSEWLNYLETLHPQAIDLGLARIQQVATILGIGHPAQRVITVAGTNGKGSCVATLAAIYLQAGYRVATYTSPHLWHFTERITINGSSVSEEALCHALTQIEQARGSISLTYFEFTTLAALYLFQQENLDIAILEVGMGGRLDAVNIIDADAMIITTIDFDHQAWLGTTREQIGFEKAGILRQGRPVVVGQDMPQAVLDQAHLLQAPIYIFNKDFSVTQKDPSTFFWQDENKILKSLPKNHLLVDNIALSLKIINLFDQEFPVDLAAMQIALKKCQLPGRQQVIQTPVWQLFDVAHNPQGIALLAAKLQANPITGRTLAVFSMLQDKDIAASIKHIAEQIDEWYVAGLSVDRGMQTDEIKKVISSVSSVPINGYAEITNAYQAALTAAQHTDRVIIFGSFYTVAQTLPPH